VLSFIIEQNHDNAKSRKDFAVLTLLSYFIFTNPTFLLKAFAKYGII